VELTSLLDGTRYNTAYGQAWWDKNAENPTGTGLLGRPHLANFELNNAYIDGWKVRKPIAW
jgi:hypothetical protein